MNQLIKLNVMNHYILVNDKNILMQQQKQFLFLQKLYLHLILQLKEVNHKFQPNEYQQFDKVSLMK